MLTTNQLLKAISIQKGNLRKKILNISLLLIVIVVITFYYFQGQLKTWMETETDDYMYEVATRNALALKERINGDLDMLNSLAIAIGAQGEFNKDYWIKVLNNKELYQEFKRVGFILPDGTGYADDVYNLNLNDREYTKRVFQGETYISEVVIDKTDHVPAIFYVAPIKQRNKIIAGISFGLYTKEYEDILDIPTFDGEGYSLIVDKQGNLIMQSKRAVEHKYPYNVFKNIEANTQDIVDMKNNMIDGKTGTIIYTLNDIDKHMVYTPVGIRDWYLLSVLPDSTIARKASTIQQMTIVLTAIIIFSLLSILSYVGYKGFKQKQMLQQLAFVDELTGFSNNNSFVMKAQNLLENKDKTYAFLVIDIDNFKLVNDVFGYEEGDLLLKEMARILNSHLSANEAFGRINADRYHALLEYESIIELEARVKSILKEIEDHTFPSDIHYNLKALIGIYVIHHQLSLDMVCDRAGLALGKAKEQSFSHYYIYNDDLRNQLIKESEVEKDLTDAINHHEFVLYLQPKYHLLTEQIAGAEALIRWQHPQKGLISPAHFIPIFERNGRITELDMFIFEEVCKLLKNRKKQGKERIRISVNQSRLHLYNSNYIRELIDIVDKYGVSMNDIELELTETIFMNDITLLKEVVSQLREKGFKVSIDDFGTGYSSLNMLKEIQVDVIKLDQEFLKEPIDFKRGKKIIEAMITMSKQLGIETVAEGVELEEQVNFLRGIGCDLAQGYYYSRPLTVEDFEKLI